jgi:DNA-binding transcriptional ArsR family regulator
LTAALVVGSLPAMALAAAPMLDALGDPTRRLVFERLDRGPLAVNAIAAGLPISRPAVSQHLRVLKDAGLVIDRAEGTRRFYQANPAALHALRAYLDRFWDRALESFRVAAEREARRLERRGGS